MNLSSYEGNTGPYRVLFGRTSSSNAETSRIIAEVVREIDQNYRYMLNHTSELVASITTRYDVFPIVVVINHNTILESSKSAPNYYDNSLLSKMIIPPYIDSLIKKDEPNPLLLL